MKVAVFYKEEKEKEAIFVKDKISKEHEVVFFDRVFVTPPQGTELVVVVGGDGTMLRAARVVPNATPLVGFKAGRIGFLTSYTVDDVDRFLEDLRDRNFREEKRWFLKAKVGGDVVLALNDVVLERDLSGKMVEIEVEVEGHSSMWFLADGVVVASPTGSTAYSLSIGGPIIFPESEVLVVSPIAPQFFFTRSVVVPSWLRVDIRCQREINLIADGMMVGKVKNLTVEKAERYVRILRPHGYDYVKVVKDKLGYGRKIE